MNYRILARLLGVITAALGLAFVLSICVSAYYLESDPKEAVALRGFGISTIIAVALAITFHICSRNANKRIFGKEALATIGTGWLLATAVGALPYLFIAEGINFADAIFESASGFTTTGASIFGNVEALPRSLLFWRSLSQWIGGLGVVVFFVAILSFLGAGAKILFSRESSAQAADLGSERVQIGVWRIMRLYLLLSFFCAMAYWAAGMSLFDAVNHMCATLSTGGFSTHNSSMAYFDSALIEWIAIAFMALGGTSFVLMLKLMQGEYNAVRQNSECKAYYLIILLASGLCVAFNLGHADMAGWHTNIRHSIFQVVSVMTTTGFATRDFDKWVPALHVVLLLLMVTGGSSGSTGGGVKVVRIVTALRYAAQLLERSYRTNVVRSIRVNGNPMSQQACEDSNGFLVIMALIAGASALFVAVLDPGLSMEGSLSATFACLFNIGPGFAEVGPTQNFAHFSIGGKLFLSLLMIMGRVELFAVLALFSPQLWKKY
ncbi:MAG: TrkH family potassium uptake protein [Opitutales bacterium]|nr:TrkH family potassium uptake protein [Opitutales bacterium]